jgi:L-fuculose-phosphate aldolase
MAKAAQLSPNPISPKMNRQEQLVSFYKFLRQHGLNDSHSGNGSVKQDSGFFITKTGACADLITRNDLIYCALDEAPGDGASLDASIHQAIYQTCPQHQAILHAHNPYTIATTLNKASFSPVDFEGKLYFGDVAVLACDADNYLSTMPKRISTALQNNSIAIVQSHGVYAAAESLELAYKWLCSIEQSAKIKWLAC